MRVSQLQLLQPFFAMAFPWPIHGQSVALSSVVFGAAVIGAVWLGRRFSIPARVGAGSA